MSKLFVIIKYGSACWNNNLCLPHIQQSQPPQVKVRCEWTHIAFSVRSNNPKIASYNSSNNTVKFHQSSGKVKIQPPPPEQQSCVVFQLYKHVRGLAQWYLIELCGRISRQQAAVYCPCCPPRTKDVGSTPLERWLMTYVLQPPVQWIGIACLSTQSCEHLNYLTCHFKRM